MGGSVGGSVGGRKKKNPIKEWEEMVGLYSRCTGRWGGWVGGWRNVGCVHIEEEGGKGRGWVGG